ncbi:hypothetical protein NFI96_030906 [Prochilodus magdalenae]|nr:hypothetical protein NFI96_030906 [Prochilodus magdalenae]
MADFTVLTINVRGLRNATKRTAVFQDLASTSPTICCLQEVHLRDQWDEALFSQQWRRGMAYWSVGGVHSTGVGILLGDRTFEKVSPFTIIQGRALGLDATWRGQNLRVLCVYAPVEASSRLDFLEVLAPFCVTNRHLVVAGDFNINLERDVDVSLKHFKKLICDFGLVDGFEFCNPGNPGYTWHNSRGASSRLDYILASSSIGFKRVSLSPRWYSDHMMVEATVSITAPPFGRGYWKLNVEILEESEFQSLFRDHFAAWLGCKGDLASPAAWWEHIKERTRALAIHYCSRRKAEKLKRVRDLERQLKTQFTCHNQGGTLDLDRVQTLRAELRALHERSAADSLFSARIQMADENETCSAFFFQRVRQAREERCFSSLKDSEGRACSDPARMMGIAHDFYANLFSKRGTDREIEEHFLSFLGNHLPSTARDSLEAPFSLTELTEVLGKMNRRKVPGLDGLPVEFYSTFWDVLGPELVEVAEDVHRQGKLTESMSSGALSLLYKKGDASDLANWRPVTMLCVDLKIFAKALTERLKKTMSVLVHSDQTCGVPGRSVTWNLHLIRDAISWVGDRKVPLALVSLDQEKAFDRVDHHFLERVLTTLGFGPNFLRWLKTLSTWSNSGPKAETLPDYYEHLVRWSRSLPAGLRSESYTKHRALYKAMLDGRGTRAVVGLEKDTWSRVQPKGLDNRLQDLNWQCVHGKLPVREILYRHGLTRHPWCPRPTCAEDENLGHVFWDCGYVQGIWTRLAGLCSKVDPQFILTKEKVMRGWPQDTRSPFLSRMWLLVSVTKRELWNTRTTLIRKGTNLHIRSAPICFFGWRLMSLGGVTTQRRKAFSLDSQLSRTEARKETLSWEEGPLKADGSAVDGDRLRDLRLMATASGETTEPGPRGSAGLDGGPSAAEGLELDSATPVPADRRRPRGGLY